VIPDIKRSRIGRSGRRYISSWLLMVLEPTAAWSVTGERGRQGCADRRFSGMKTASLEGRIHGVSARPCLRTCPATNTNTACQTISQTKVSRPSIGPAMGHTRLGHAPDYSHSQSQATSHKPQKTKNPPIRRVFWQKERDLT